MDRMGKYRENIGRTREELGKGVIASLGKGDFTSE